MTYEDWENLKKKLKLHCEDFLKTARQIPADSFNSKTVTGSWTTHDVSAHLAGWFEEAVERMKEYSDFDMIEEISYDIDEFNRQTVESAKNLSREEILTRLEKAFDSLHRFAETLQESDREQTMRYEQWLEILLHEVTHHHQQVRELLQ